ncbi:SDR family NAD(P)-dependent oxidoreductase [Lactobacillus sp. LC28-10]|uniref:SDR family NAD(P)-dependent oxidoreductase n=1 Tax=Secundilactobacillus angelensis TaxID=2722706 RepID=A0ABX1L0V8_9LACO|nr:SDR family NAD(P)-dependent oxidoreductase [Secundilactobacillus angelensis]MCH5462640.1 SDR family NAD(P)-dependent oxidoreductase [Secundilactobacillus angelensis]NLR19132.1 SDR family NAD(P)-dependent oxidoreductase [Secundilactobacillus angelensis]
MKLANHHILITGGTAGIGFALSQKFVELGNTVLVVDSNEEKLDEVKSILPDLVTFRADLSDADERRRLAKWVQSNFWQLDVLINNAGIQRGIDLKRFENLQSWDWYHHELAMNFEAPLHLTLLLLALITRHKESAIMNVSSGLTMTTGARTPIFTASKKAVHGFTQSLRLQLENSNTSVFEILPPSFDNDIGSRSDQTFGSELDNFVSAVMDQLEDGYPEITFDTSWTEYARLRNNLKF